MSEVWTPTRRKQPAAKGRLLLLPHAGGSASAFREWFTGMPEGVEICPIQLPGREHRFEEPPVGSLAQLVEHLVDGVAHVLDRPYVLYGHSMGAWIAFELARALRSRGLRLPSHLIAGAAPAPDVPDVQGVHAMTLDEAIEHLREGGQTPDDILDNREIMEMAWPVLRADSAITETHQFIAGDPLDVPITALAADEDHLLTRDMIDSWARHTTSKLVVHTVAGGHLFHLTPSERVRSTVISILRAALGLREDS